MDLKQGMKINQSLVDALLSAGNALALKNNLPNDLSLSTVMLWPEVLQTDLLDINDLQAPVIDLFKQALAQLNEVRRNEGKVLAAQLRLRQQRMREELIKSRAYSSNTIETVRGKVMTRLLNLQLEVDSQRIEQELALLLLRMDVSEELDRLDMHLMEVDKCLNNTEIAGRRLDFLMQELHREANTLGSKSDSHELTQCAIEMKVLIEQMREQIQNIE